MDLIPEISPRNVQGIDTVEVLFPVDVKERYLQLFPQISAQDYRDPRFSMTARFYWLDPKDDVWRRLAGDVQWRGHPDNDPSDPDSVFAHQIDTLFDSSNVPRDIRGQLIRAELIVPTRMRVGLKIVASDTSI
jgi:hypothetical protein